jgi:hypothetical protein
MFPLGVVFAIPVSEAMASIAQVNRNNFNSGIFGIADACLNFCLNDGICRKNKLGQVECACKENFSGERCEIRFQAINNTLKI